MPYSQHSDLGIQVQFAFGPRDAKLPTISYGFSERQALAASDRPPTFISSASRPCVGSVSHLSSDTAAQDVNGVSGLTNGPSSRLWRATPL